MEFIVSKLLWLCLSPLNMIVLLCMASAILGGCAKKYGRISLGLAAAIAIVIIVLPTGRIMLHNLEQSRPPLRIMPAKVDGILILGGAFNASITQAIGQTTLNDASERVTEASRLMRLYPNATVIYSDGNGSLDRTLPPETGLFQRYLREQGLSDARVIYERRSRNTYENIMYSLSAAHPDKTQTWMIVTSAWHMPRVMAVVAKQRWPGTIIADPVDFHTMPGWHDFLFSADMLANLTAFQTASHEYIGLIAYRIGGKIDSPL